MESFFDFTPLALQNLLVEEYRCRPFVSSQILSWVYERQVWDFDKMSDLAQELRSKLKERFHFTLSQKEKTIQSKDAKTIKVTLVLQDGKKIESVLMKEGKGATICLSSQVGCAQGCVFCATGTMGIKRNLTASEIVTQVLFFHKTEGIDLSQIRLVFMGMGEPFHNLNQVFKSLEILTHKQALKIGARRITVSTSGVIKGIYRLMENQPQVQLAISLHTVEQDVRRIWVPNCKDTVDEILQAAREFNKKTGRKITFEMVLFGGKQIQTAKINKLGQMLQGIHCNVNLIPYNPIPDLGPDFVRPSHQEIEYFRSILKRWHTEVTVRISKGRDIQAACGQLIAN